MSQLFKLTILIVLTLSQIACSTPELFVEEAKYFERHVKGHADLNFPPQTDQAFNLNYVSSGAIEQPAVVYIHGTPGNWRNASRYLMDKQLQAQARLVAIDRPGWGDSQLVDKGVEPSFTKQAALIKPLLERLKRDNEGAGIVLVGHSLGASLAPRIAVEYPELVDALILISGSLDPKLGKPRWYNRAASMGVVSWFLDSGLRRANREIMPLHRQLQEMEPLWPEINIPVTLIQGMKDELVYPANADFAEKVLVNADLTILRLEEAGHFIPWENWDSVTGAIVDILNRLKANAQQQ